MIGKPVLLAVGVACLLPLGGTLAHADRDALASRDGILFELAGISFDFGPHARATPTDERLAHGSALEIRRKRRRALPRKPAQLTLGAGSELATSGYRLRRLKEADEDHLEMLAVRRLAERIDRIDGVNPLETAARSVRASGDHADTLLTACLGPTDDPHGDALAAIREGTSAGAPPYQKTEC